jgi:PAS domain S-box-containing protein
MTFASSRAGGGWPWQFFELAGAILLALGPDGTVTYINQKGADTLGYPVEQILGKDWFDHFLPAPMRGTVREVFLQITAGAANFPERFANPVVCRDGSERLIAWRSGAMRGPSGRIVMVLCSGEDVTEQRRAEAALRESEARFRATFDQTAVGMAHVGLDWRFLRLNEKLCQITGYTRAELEARTFGDITHPDDLEADLAQAEALRAGSIPHYTIEKRYIHKDGSAVWVRLTGSLVRNAHGQPKYFIAVVDDITPRKQAELLLANEELQRMALSCADAGAWQWEAGGSLSWMPKTYQIFGLDPAEKPPGFEAWLERCVHRDDRHFFVDALQRASDAAGSDFRIDFRCTHPDLGVRWVTSVGRVICEEDGGPVSAYGIVLDITEARRKEQLLHASEERLRMAMAAGDIGVWDWDIPSGSISWSDNFTELTGIETGAFPTNLDGWRALVHPDDRERVEAALDQALAAGSEYEIEFRMVGPDSRLRWTATHGAVIRDDAGRPVRMIGIDRDVTARKSSEQRQELIARELDHRVRNILAVVQAIAQRSVRPGPDREVLVGRLGALGKANALLLAAGGEAVDLGDIVAQELAPFPAEQVTILGPRVPLPPRAVQMVGLALHELATNAVKYGGLSSEEGRVFVKWSVISLAEDTLKLEWSERGGPAVETNGKSGFGSQLLRGAGKALGGRMDFSYRPEGFQATLEIPLRHVIDERPS